LFVDTGAWIALNMERDHLRSRAREFITEATSGGGYGNFHTSEFILQETYTYVLYRYGQTKALELLQRIAASEVIVHPFGTLEFTDVIDGMSREPTKLSFVDWTSVLLMERYSIKHIFSFDSDFDTLGFERVPRGR